MAILHSNDNGFTLVEVLVALLIMMVGVVGLLQAINFATEYNLKNHLRDEAVYVGERYLNDLKEQGFDNIALTYPLLSTASKVRGTGKKLMVETGSTVLSSDGLGNPTTKQLNVTVRWIYKGTTYVNRVSAPLSKMP